MINLFFPRFALKASLRAEQTQGRIEKRPQRGLMYITAGLDLRGQYIRIATTPRGSHNKNNCTVVRHLRSRPLHSYIYRRSRPAVMHSATSPRSLCPLGPQGRFQSEAGKEQVYHSIF